MIADLEMADLVREVCHDSGAGPLVLGGPLSGYRAFAGAVPEGARFPYAIAGIARPDQWETGNGLLDGEGRLVRDPVASSAGGAAVAFAEGEKHVALTPHAAWLAAVDGHGHAIAQVEGLAGALADKQAASGALTAIAAIAATDFGRAALALADGAAFRAHIGAGTSSTAGTVTSVALSGGATGLSVSGGPVTDNGTMTLAGTLGIASGGTGATTASAARAGLGLAIGTHVQAHSANLSAIAAQATAADRISYWSGSGTAATVPLTSYARTLLDDDTAATARATLGLGGIAVQNPGGVSITGGSISGIVDLAIADGGTGASSASVARANLAVGGLADANIWSAAQTYSLSPTMPGMIVNGAAGVARALDFRTSGTIRWRINVDGSAESGGNAGSNLGIFAYDDAGAFIASYMNIVRATGEISFGNLVRSVQDNNHSLGTAARRWSVVYAGTGSINTSDAREKCEVRSPADALLDAWSGVEWRMFRFTEAVAAKGDAARWHSGAVAQQVRDVIDAAMGEGAAVRLGLVCHDRWDASPDAPAGDRWGLRYDECFAVEAASQRRRLDRIEAMLEDTRHAAG